MGTRLLVGLGNPGPEYSATRHNAGFRLIDLLRERWSLGAPRDGGSYLYWRADQKGHQVHLLQPLTYMNRSGQAVRQFMSQTPIEIANMLVAYDDISLPVGDIRIRTNGSDGGQKGIRDLIATLGTQEIPRLRIGVGGERSPVISLAEFVLSPFASGELPRFESALVRAADAVELWLDRDLKDLMSQFNVRSFAASNGERISETRGE